MHTFSVGKGEFLLDGAPFRILSGAIHYFRVPRELWRDRLEKLRDCGFNTVETYIACNAHMPDEDTFLTDGMLDIGAFLDLAKELGLWAIVRPGPYICSEWDFGGLPWWMLKDECALRCMDPAYLKHLDTYFDRVMPVLTPHLITNGGNILMMQVENEYGSYGDDREYLAYIRDGMLRRGADVPLFTSDGDCKWMLTGGTLPGTLSTVNFGSRPAKCFEALRTVNTDGPLMCAEYWNGWFDHWGEEHHSRDAADAAQTLDEMLAMGASVSLYMFHGGTNFGYMNGANCPALKDYQPTISSYDDDALLDECGDITPKYRLVREVMKKYASVPEKAEPAPCKKANYGEVRFTKALDLINNAAALGRVFKTAAPRSMEKFGQGYGFILYSTTVRGPREEMTLNLQEVHDRAHIFVDGRFMGIIYRNDEKSNVSFAVPAEGVQLDILVENMGRVNYGPYLRDEKGITCGVRLGQQFIYGWTVTTLPLDDISKAVYADEVKPFDGRPVLLTGTFDAGDAPADTFVKLPGFRKGIIFINGKPLSRHWEIGPQRSAYLPAPFMKPGVNTLTVLELDGYDTPAALLSDTYDIGEKAQ